MPTMELKSLRLFVAGVGLHLGLALKGWHRCLPRVPHEPRLLLQGPAFFFKAFV